MSTNKNNARTKRLFARFAVVYGHIWQSQYKQENQVELADKEWSETLEHIGDESIEMAFKDCKKRFDMPPTLPIFYQLCRSYQPKKSANIFVNAECKPADEKTVENYLKQLREIFTRQ